MSATTLESLVGKLDKMCADQKKLEKKIAMLGHPERSAEALLPRNSGRLIHDADEGLRPAGKHWTKGIGMGDFLCAMVKTMSNPAAPENVEMMRKRFGVTKAALAETAGATGGYTIPPEFSARLLMLVMEDSIAMKDATVIPMTTRTYLMPALDVTTRYSAGQTPFLGGIVANWTEEAQLRTETEPQFRQLELVARELSGYTVASNTMLQDNAVGLDALLSQLFTYAVSWYSDFAFIQGNGVGKPLGFLSSPACIFVTASVAGTIQTADIAGMYAKLLPQSYNRAVWLISPSAIPFLLQLKDAAGNNIFFPRSGLHKGDGGPIQPEIQWQMLGRPVLVTEKMPVMTSTASSHQGIALVDWALYLVGMRMEIEVAVSPHYKFPNNQTVWRFVARLDGRTWLDNSVRLQDGTTVLSPFVGLTT